MNTSQHQATWQVVRLPWKTFAVTLLAVLATFFITGVTTLALAGPSYADTGGDGGGGKDPDTNSGDGCVVTGWAFTRDPSQIKLVGGADGTLCGNPSEPIQGLRDEGATGCANNRSDVIALWYVVDDSGSWATSNGGGDDVIVQSRGNLRAVIDSTPAASLKKANGSAYPNYSPAVIRSLGKQAIARNDYNTVVCVWLGSTPTTTYQCSYLDDWGRYVPALSPTSVFRGAAEAQANCFVPCPTTAPKNAGRLIPIAYSDNRAAFCGQPMTYTEQEIAYVYYQSCAPGELVTFNANLSTSGPEAYNWRTMIDNGGPHPGPTSFEPQAVDLPTPLAELFAANPNPSAAQIEAALAASGTASHAAIDRLSDTNEKALAEGGVMNVREWTTYVQLATTTTDRIVTPYTACTDLAQARQRTRAVTQTDETYRTWQQRDRDRNVQDQQGVACGRAQIPASAEWDIAKGSTCNNGNRNEFRYGIYVWGAWDGWNDKTGDACNDERNWANQQREIRDCQTQTRPVTTYGTWSDWSDLGAPIVGEITISYGTPSSTRESTVVEVQPYSTPQLTAFWQTLATHCNSTGFRDAAQGFEVLTTSIDESGKHSGAVVTPRMAGGNAPVWGVGARSPKGTTSAGFFDKQCAYEGVRTVRSEDERERVFFRDNQLRNVTVPTYRPESVGVVSDDASEALATVLTRWQAGTPQVNGYGNGGGSFRSYSSDGQQVFAANNKAAPVFKNWGFYSTDGAVNWSVVKGEENVFQMGGTWASDTGRPNVFTTKWIFAPLVATRVPMTNVGFANGGGARSFVPAQSSVKVQGQVMGLANNGDTSAALTSEVEANTGSGVTVNSLDSSLVAGAPTDKWLANPTGNAFYNSVRLVRAVQS